MKTKLTDVFGAKHCWSTPKVRHINRCVLKASHWHDQRFTPWHAILRASEGRTRESVRGDARGCVEMRVMWRSACHVVAKILKCSKIHFQGVTTCHDEIVVKCTCVTLGVTHFTNSS